MICATCGRDNAEHVVFCLECGQRLGARIAPPTPPVGLPQPSALAPPSRATPVPSAPRPPAPNFKFSGRGAPPPADQAADIVHCASCGQANQRGLRFCVACGQLVDAPPRAPTQPLAAQAPQQAPPLPPPPLPAPASASYSPFDPIAPSRVVALGPPPAPRSASRVCARCRGASDPSAQFCKFCGAPLADAPAPGLSPPAPPTTPRDSRAPIITPVTSMSSSSMPETPAVDDAQYLDYRTMSAAPSAASPPNALNTIPPTAVPTIAPPPPAIPVDRSPRAQSVASPAVPSPGPYGAYGNGSRSTTSSVAGARIVIIARDGGEGPAFPLGDVTDIGRSDGNVLVAEDRFISPRHARITRRGSELFLRDLGSANGIYLRIAPMIAGAGGGGASTSQPPGAPIEVGLQDQDLFLVGQQVLRFEVVRDADEGFGAASQHGTLLFGTPASPRYARLSQRTVEGVTRDVFYIRKAETVLGRESGDIVFTDDPFLSRRHASIRYDAGSKRFTLADLGSSNGTFLQLREEVRLKDGDHFRVGQQLFRVDIEPSPAPPMTDGGWRPGGGARA